MNRPTNSTIFLLPGLGLNRHELEEKYGFVNAYVADKDKTIRIKGVYLLFSSFNGHFFEDYPEFGAIMEDLYEPIDTPNAYVHHPYIVMVLPFPKHYIKDYNKILKGEYSKLSKSYKELFPMERNGKPSLYYHIFNKTDGLKNYWENNLDAELDVDKDFWQIFDTEQETLDINKIFQDEEIS